MAKVGYIMATSQYDKLEEDRKWMNEFGCVRIIEEVMITNATDRCGNN